MSSSTTFIARAHDRGRHGRYLYWRLLPHRPRQGLVNLGEKRMREGEDASCPNQGAVGSLKASGGIGSGRAQDSCSTSYKEAMICRQKKGYPPRRRPLSAERSTGSPEKTCNYGRDLSTKTTVLPSLALDSMLEKRFLRLKEKLHEFAKADSHTYILESEDGTPSEENKGKRTNRRVSWQITREGD